MIKIFLFIPVLLMTSCHINDPRPEIHRAMVSVVDDRVCITLPDTKNESISLFTISEAGHGENRIKRRSLWKIKLSYIRINASLLLVLSLNQVNHMCFL